jgi:hypothetical protein
MATTIRAELSEKNKYWIDKHRYYELKHFCLQYPIWKRAYTAIDGLLRGYSDLASYRNTNIHSDSTAKCVEKMSYYFERMNLVEKAAHSADPELANYILKGVTEELSYTYLKTRLEMPCGRDMYYDRYRRFFWLLNKARN